jgi:O-antigen/teichoic acid export membrane protein
MSGTLGQRPVLLWAAESGRLVVGFAVLAITARVAGAEEQGAYLSIVSLASLAPRLLDLGLPLAIGYFLRLKPGGYRPCAQLLARHLALAMPFAGAAALALTVYPFEGAAADRLAASHWPQVSLLVLSELVLLLGTATFIPTWRYKAYLVSALLPSSIMLGGIVLHLLAQPLKPVHAGNLLNLLAAATTAGAIFVVLAVHRASRQGSEQHLVPGAVYRYGLRTYASALAKISAQRFDRLYLPTVLGSSGYAQYSVGVSIRDMFTFPANLYSLTLRNRQIDLIGRHHDVPAARLILLRSSATWMLGSIVVAIVSFPFWDLLTTLAFGHEMRPTADCTKILMFSCGPLAVMNFSWNHLYALNQPGRVTFLTVGLLVLAIPLFALAIALVGPSDGVAYASVTWAVFGSAVSLAWAVVSQPPLESAR